MNQEKYIVSFVDYWRESLGNIQYSLNKGDKGIMQLEGMTPDEEEAYPGEKYFRERQEIIPYRFEEGILAQKQSESGASYNMDEHNGGLDPSSRRRKVIIFGDTET